MSSNPEVDEKLRDAYATIGELVLVSNALDLLLSAVMISVLNLGQSPMLVPVVATLDPVRKVEILKARYRLINDAKWRDGVRQFVEKVEAVSKQRNIACHTPPSFSSGELTLTAVAAAKMFKSIDLEKRSSTRVPVADFKSALSVAKDAFESGELLIKNFERVNAESARRKDPPSSAR